MTTQTLRQLARSHADGEIDKASYRKARSDLIQGILDSSIPLEDIEYPPLVQPPEPESLDDTQRREDVKKPPVNRAEPEASTAPNPGSSESGESKEEGKSNTGLYIGLAVAILALVIVVVLFFVKGKDESMPQSTDSAANSMPAQVSGDSESDAGMTAQSQSQLLIKDFLNAKNWSSSSLDNFLSQWSELPEGDVMQAAESLELGQLTNAIYKQLLEEQALSGLVDDDSSMKKQAKLVEFAREIGINDSRINLPESPSAAEEMIEKIEP